MGKVDIALAMRNGIIFSWDLEGREHITDGARTLCKELYLALSYSSIYSVVMATGTFFIKILKISG